MMTYNAQTIANTVNGYKVEDIILWTFGLFLGAVSLVFSILSYYFANKSTKLITELMEKTWVTSETDKYFFVNMKSIKHQNNKALMLLNSGQEISYETYVSNSIGSRIIHINKETIDLLTKTKYKNIIMTYVREKKNCDKKFFESVKIENITSSSKKLIPAREIVNLIEYHEMISSFVSHILKEYTELTI